MPAEELKIAEVIETASTGFTAQCYDLDAPPALGSLVKTSVDGVMLFAVVSHVTTASFDSGRKPIARGRDEATEDAIFKANPHLEKLIRCEVEALIVGYAENGAVRHHLPPRPARLHGFVYNCSNDEIRNFSRNPGYIPLLLAARGEVSAEEMTAAAIRRLSYAYEGDERRLFLTSSGKALAQLLSADYNRLKTILERLAV